MSAIVIRGLTKKFRRNIVLDQLDLEVYDGEIFSLMGLKDSGKTTLARILFNFLKVNQGTVSIFDMDALKESKMVKEFCGYVPEDVWIYDNLKPLSIFKRTLGFHDLKNTDDIDFLMDYFEVDNKEKFMDMSDAKRKRVSIINALITKPKLLILDEPNKYVSLGMVEKLFSHLRHLQETEGLSVLMLTESLSLGQRYADRGAYLMDGKIVDLEYIKDKDTNDKVLRIFDEVIPVQSFESIGAKLLKEDQGQTQFFYNGYLPTLTTVLFQERIKNYTIEDAILEEKIKSYNSSSKQGQDSIFTRESSGEILSERDNGLEDTSQTISLREPEESLPLEKDPNFSKEVIVDSHLSKEIRENENDFESFSHTRQVELDKTISFEDSEKSIPIEEEVSIHKDILKDENISQGHILENGNISDSEDPSLEGFPVSKEPFISEEENKNSTQAYDPLNLPTDGTLENNSNDSGSESGSNKFANKWLGDSNENEREGM